MNGLTLPHLHCFKGQDILVAASWQRIFQKIFQGEMLIRHNWQVRGILGGNIYAEGPMSNIWNGLYGVVYNFLKSLVIYSAFTVFLGEGTLKFSFQIHKSYFFVGFALFLFQKIDI